MAGRDDDGTGEGSGAADPFDGLRLDDDFVAGARRTEASAEERAARARRMDADLRRLEEPPAPRGAVARRSGRWRGRTRRRPRPGRGDLGRYVTIVVVLAGLGVAAFLHYRDGGGALAGGGFDGVLARSILEADAGGRPPPPSAASATPLGRPVPLTGETGSFAFTATGPDGEPARYDPCRVIQVVVNDGEAPPGHEVFLERALAHTSEVSGLRFEVEGTTDESAHVDRPAYLPDRYGDRWAPVLVDWSDSSRVPELAGDIAGIGGSVPVTAADGSWVYVSGLIALDSDDLAQTAAQPAGEAYVVGILAHELGHLLGLDHVDDPGELMHLDNLGRTGFGPGDRAGLADLGTGDCHPDL